MLLTFPGRLFRFRLRTLLVVVALTAVALAIDQRFRGTMLKTHICEGMPAFYVRWRCGEPTEIKYPNLWIYSAPRDLLRLPGVSSMQPYPEVWVLVEDGFVEWVDVTNEDASVREW